MSELTHLDELEAEAIYIIREVASRVRKARYALLHRQGQFSNASPCNESVLSGKTADPIHAY